MPDFKVILCDVEERQIHNESGDYTVADIIAKHQLVKPRNVYINGVEHKRYNRYRLQDQDELLLYMGAPGEDVWSAVSGAALFIGGMFLTTVSPILGLAAMGVGLGLLSGALGGNSSFNPQIASSNLATEISGTSASTIAGQDMTANTNGKVPLILGAFSYRPDLITNSYLTCIS